MKLCDQPDKVPLEEFLPELRLIVSNVPSDIAAAYIRTAAIEFAERSLKMKRTVAVELQCGVEQYLLEPPDEDESRTVAIDEVCDHRGRRWTVLANTPCQLNCLCACGAGIANAAYPEWPLNLGTATSLPVWFQQPNSLFVRGPVRDDFNTNLRVRLSVAPKRDVCSGIDREIYERYLMGIVAGAAGYLLAQPKQEWYNPQLAQKYERDFKIASSRAAVDALIGESRGPFRATSQRIV